MYAAVELGQGEIKEFILLERGENRFVWGEKNA